MFPPLGSVVGMTCGAPSGVSSRSSGSAVGRGRESVRRPVGARLEPRLVRSRRRCYFRGEGTASRHGFPHPGVARGLRQRASAFARRASAARPARPAPAAREPGCAGRRDRGRPLGRATASERDQERAGARLEAAQAARRRAGREAGNVNGDGILLTRSHGYVLTVAPGELDLDRFQSLTEEGRRALAAGRADDAAERMREALGLWRGPPLAELAYDSFAQVEIARLEELRLSALEQRIEADLALGRHHHLIPEVEALVTENPLRERLRGQLMLALYRSGRQAEALQAYQRARHTLVDEL